MSDTIHQAVQAVAAETVALRRDFHQHPEIAFEEVRTAGIIAERLAALGLPVQTGIGKTGVTALLDTGKPGKTVLARADIDALPVHEERDTPYRSTVPGKMHACGHDGHAAVLLSTAKILTEQKDSLSGKVFFVFQPAEEVVGGAKAMLEDDALKDVTPDYSIALHLSSSEPVGTVAVRSGPSMAASDAFRIVIRGKGGHAAMPHASIDPVVAAAQVITALQTLVSREVDPVEQAVISITALNAGTAYNIIPETVELKGTLRTFSASLRDYLQTRIEEVVTGVAQTLRCTAGVAYLHGSPAVVNHDGMTERLKAVARGVVGADNLIPMAPIMGGDDMALWLEQAPGCYFFVGARNDDKDITYPHHHPMFDIDEASLPIAVEMLTRGVIDYLDS